MTSFGENPNLLIVGNFSLDTGYAWETIQEYFVALSGMFIEQGRRAIICFPQVTDIPTRFNSTDIEIVECDISKSSFFALFRLIRDRRIGVLYLTDWPTFSLRYLCARLAGIRTIIVHKRTHGGQDLPGSLKALIKRALNRSRLFSADRVIAISEYIRNRLVTVSCFPDERVYSIWNGVDVEKFKPGFDPYVFFEYGIPKHKRIVFACSRAVKYKGIEVLIEAADILIHQKNQRDLVFLYCGDGPDLDYFRAKVRNLKLQDYFLCPGQTQSVYRILKGVEVVAVPSLWEEPFGLAVIEAMATKKVVIASKVGGIIDIISDAVDGYLVPGGHANALADKIMDVMNKPEAYREMRERARGTVVRKFNITSKKEELLDLVARTSGMVRSC